MFASLGSHYTEVSWFSTYFSTTNPSFPPYSFTIAISQSSISSVTFSLLFSLYSFGEQFIFSSFKSILSHDFSQICVFMSMSQSTIGVIHLGYLIRLITTNRICPTFRLPSPFQKIINVSTFYCSHSPSDWSSNLLFSFFFFFQFLDLVVVKFHGFFFQKFFLCIFSAVIFV